MVRIDTEAVRLSAESLRISPGTWTVLIASALFLSLSRTSCHRISENGAQNVDSESANHGDCPSIVQHKATLEGVQYEVTFDFKTHTQLGTSMIKQCPESMCGFCRATCEETSWNIQCECKAKTTTPPPAPLGCLGKKGQKFNDGLTDDGAIADDGGPGQVVFTVVNEESKVGDSIKAKKVCKGGEITCTTTCTLSPGRAEPDWVFAECQCPPNPLPTPKELAGVKFTDLNPAVQSVVQMAEALASGREINLADAAMLGEYSKNLGGLLGPASLLAPGLSYVVAAAHAVQQRYDNLTTADHKALKGAVETLQSQGFALPQDDDLKESTADALQLLAATAKAAVAMHPNATPALPSLELPPSVVTGHFVKATWADPTAMTAIPESNAAEEQPPDENALKEKMKEMEKKKEELQKQVMAQINR
eukprot:TRINITY_DN1703_c1_g1_i1.p1 TRINITY_DN1703_c1_g1~~TRINITY_DN1703_c1_g1_i1.p1  ORF type:complete len:421 (+),score=81.24 TRINITY_DN1703_c1_g1_i1:123-1385(+)